MPENWQDAGFGLYIHWPFCAAKCPYCDFNSHVVASIDHDAWERAYLEELERAAAETQGRTLQTVFFGGGTPSLMEPRVVGRILDKVSGLWTLANDHEITLEANPSSVDAAKFESMAGSGVNRISLGVQAMSDDDLRRLGRLHSVKDARHGIDLAMQHFERASFDLIYARQNQSAADWERELKQALTLGISHLSLYQLTIEDGTVFKERFRQGKLRGLPDEDVSAEMYQITQEACESAGLPRYEVSNHAAPGQEARHNLIYWNSGDWLGIGPGAHGRLTLDKHRLATEQCRLPSQWLSGNRNVPSQELPNAEIAQEMVLMGLRLRAGLDLERLHRRTGYHLNNLDDLILEGWLLRQDNHVSVTDEGVFVLNAIIERLLDDRELLGG